MCGESEVYCSGWSSSRPFSQDDWGCVGPRVCMMLGHAHQLLWDCGRAWGQVTPTVASKTDEGCRNGTHRHSAPRESRISACPSSRCFKISKWISSHTVSVLFKLLFLCSAPGWVTVCVSPLGVKSLLPMPQWASWIYPVCFQRHTFWGLLLWCRFQGWGAWYWAWTPGSSERSSVFVRLPPDCGRVEFLWDHKSASPTALM